MSEVVSRVFTKGWRVGVAGWARVRPQNEGRPRLESRDENKRAVLAPYWLVCSKIHRKMSGQYYQAVHQ